MNFRSTIIRVRIISTASHLRQMRAVGIVTQTGAYFFLASGVPGFGSSSAMAILAMEQAAAAAAANTNSLLPLFSSFTSTFFSSILGLSPTALTTKSPRRAGSLARAELEVGRRQDVIVTEAMFANSGKSEVQVLANKYHWGVSAKDMNKKRTPKKPSSISLSERCSNKWNAYKSASVYLHPKGRGPENQKNSIECTGTCYIYALRKTTRNL